MSSAVRAGSGVFVAFLAAATVAAAQVPKVYFGLGGGLTVPTSDFHADAAGDGYKTGWQGMAFAGLKLPAVPVGFRVDGTYGENSANDKLNADLSTQLGQPATSKAKLFGASVDATYEFATASPAKVYLLAGIGFYNFKLAVTSGGSTADTSETKFAWNGGAGVRFAVSSLHLFVEGRYVDISSPFGASVKFIPVVAGVQFGGK